MIRCPGFLPADYYSTNSYGPGWFGDGRVVRRKSSSVEEKFGGREVRKKGSSGKSSSIVSEG